MWPRGTDKNPFTNNPAYATNTIKSKLIPSFFCEYREIERPITSTLFHAKKITTHRPILQLNEYNKHKFTHLCCYSSFHVGLWPRLAPAHPHPLGGDFFIILVFHEKRIKRKFEHFWKCTPEMYPWAPPFQISKYATDCISLSSIDVINVRKKIKNVKKRVFINNKKTFVNVIKTLPSFYLLLMWGLL